MNRGVIFIVLSVLAVLPGFSQDFEVNFKGGEQVIDSVLATNLKTGETIKIPGDATLILRENATGNNLFQIEISKISVIYPPSGKGIIINYPSLLQQEINIGLFDISGRVIAQKKFAVLEGINQFFISAKQPGFYFINILSGNTQYSDGIIICGWNNTDISYAGLLEMKSYHALLKSLQGDSYVLLFTPGDIISYEFYGGGSKTIINEEAGTSTILEPEFHECVDYEGNSYAIVNIGDQWWMAENLRSTRYHDGSEILVLEDNDLWSHLLPDAKAGCYFNNDESLGYGRLYTYSAAINGVYYDSTIITQGICPDGWHVPDNDEWMEMENYLINNGYNFDGTTTGNKIGKSMASTHGWMSADWIGNVGNDQRSNNRTGFNGLPAGFRGDETGIFQGDGISGYWWSRSDYSASTAFSWYLEYENNSLNHSRYNSKTLGFSVRCIRDNYSGLSVNFRADKTEVSLGEEVNFTDLSSDDPTKWEWYFGDGVYSAEQNPMHIYYSPGAYTVTLFAENSYGSNREVKINYINVLESKKRILSDIEGNVYKSKKIGNQLWMAENLKTTKYADGTDIPNVTDNTEWGSLAADNSARAYCYFNNNESSVYGALYTYAAAVNGTPYDGTEYLQGVCPDGWHLPAETEWNELENYLIANGYNFDGSMTGNKIAKSLASDNGWTVSTNEGAIGNNQSTNNRSGFSGQPGGYRSYYSTTGEFDGAGEGGYWWMADDIFEESAMFWNLYYDYKHVLRDYTFKRTGLSVRCLKDDDGSPLADFTSDVTEVKLGELVSFTDLSTNSPTEWIWYFDGPGETSIEQNPTHRFTREGLNRVSLIVRNEAGYDVETKQGYINVTQRKSVVNDIEGNIYRTVEIGDQWWMAENLKTTKFRDGANIPLVTSSEEWLATSTPAYVWYKYNPVAYADIYGALYNWYSINSGKLCPSGWHIPSDNDWKELEMSLGMSPNDIDSIEYRGTYEGSKLAGNADLWNYEEFEILYIESNEHFGTSGFDSLPGGSLLPCQGSICSGIVGFDGYWWSSTEFDTWNAWYRSLDGGSTRFVRNYRSKRSGLSVRCVKD